MVIYLNTQWVLKAVKLGCKGSAHENVWEPLRGKRKGKISYQGTFEVIGGNGHFQEHLSCTADKRFDPSFF